MSIGRSESGQLFAYIRAKRTAVYVHPNSAKAVEAVTYSLVVEPMYLFFVPAASLSLLGYLAVVLLFLAASGLPSRIMRALQAELVSLGNRKTQ